LKHILRYKPLGMPLSHPAGVRGLKHNPGDVVRLTAKSHPAGVRGLKQWALPSTPPCRGRTPQGCVD